MSALIVGASAGLGRALAESLARGGHDLYLLASDDRDLEPLAQDLSLRYGIRIHYEAMDLMNTELVGLRERVLAALPDLDNLLLIAGYSDARAVGPLADADCLRLMTINFVAGVRLINLFLGHLMARQGGNIVGAGSVAAARGRSNNAVYAASKRGLEFYFETLRHFLALSKSPCRVQWYRLGYMQTRMTFGQKLMFKSIAPEVAAAAITQNLGKDIPLRYLPRWWFIIMTIIRSLPWPIFRRLDI
ncbi:MAG: SDR family NAD(P)-dependent oxidoreductase [Magnetococcales bacterium]|nr:SDR family NAD(P)-dependent oxidoreductase [Magnetococcales bacterium]MBF0156244.1 SDR family NAD(P)-dependent oxidoreductase [Magnetococcales bacterium]